MKRTTRTMMAMGLAVALAGLMACIEDDSAPNRRGMERPALGAGPGGTNNAEKRELEAPKRDLPTGRQEFPGQTRLNTPDGVITLAEMGTAAETQPAPPATAPAAATSTEASPGTMRALGLNEDHHVAITGRAIPVPWANGMVIEGNWGTVAAMPEYRHRNWPDQQTTYVMGDVKGNPVYFTSLLVAYDYYDPARCEQCHAAGPNTIQNLKDLADVPWFFGEALALPVLMVCDQPLAQKTTAFVVRDPVYQGYLPPAGEVRPSGLPGEVQWIHVMPTLPPDSGK